MPDNNAPLSYYLLTTTPKFSTSQFPNAAAFQPIYKCPVPQARGNISVIVPSSSQCQHKDEQREKALLHRASEAGFHSSTAIKLNHHSYLMFLMQVTLLMLHD